MSTIFVVEALCLISIIVAGSSTPVKRSADQDIRKCAQNFCQVALFKCVSQDSCNGTLVLSTEPCQCCPTCIKFKEEGEPCEADGEENSETKKLESDDVHIPLVKGTETVEKATAGETKKSSKLASKNEKNCKPGLTCMQGTCVTVY